VNSQSHNELVDVDTIKSGKACSDTFVPFSIGQTLIQGQTLADLGRVSNPGALYLTRSDPKSSLGRIISFRFGCVAVCMSCIQPLHENSAHVLSC
jgi:hypothetical protein